MDPDAVVEIDAFPFARFYKSGRVERLPGSGVVPAGLDPATGVASKDVLISPDTGVTARLFAPPSDGGEKFPVVVYFHGGAFLVQTPFSPTYHDYLCSLVSKAKVVALSVDYRLAPEHVLPAAYDDAWDALQWVASHHADGRGSEPWLVEHGDFQRLYLAGDSAGGNIVHNVALRAASEASPAIKGLVLVHPSFWTAEPKGEGSEEVSEMVRKKWRVACPDSPGPLEDPRLNPVGAGAGAARLRGLPCRRVLVAMAGEDVSWREGGRAYCEGLRRSGWGGEVEMVESEGEKHVFHLFDRHSQKARALMEALAAFYNSD